MSLIYLREPERSDQTQFLEAMQSSVSFHHPWVKAPTTPAEFEYYVERHQAPDHKSYIIWDEANHLIGVFNISGIVRGVFQSAYLGFYANSEFAGTGLMSLGLKQVLQMAFNELTLHRLEANIQPENKRSIEFVKRAGFRYEGYSPRYLKIYDEWCGHEHWAMTAEEFIR